VVVVVLGEDVVSRRKERFDLGVADVFQDVEGLLEREEVTESEVDVCAELHAW
jgi:hypothetical protein